MVGLAFFKNEVLSKLPNPFINICTNHHVLTPVPSANYVREIISFGMTYLSSMSSFLSLFSFFSLCFFKVLALKPRFLQQKLEAIQTTRSGTVYQTTERQTIRRRVCGRQHVPSCFSFTTANPRRRMWEALPESYIRSNSETPKKEGTERHTCRKNTGQSQFPYIIFTVLHASAKVQSHHQANITKNKVAQQNTWSVLQCLCLSWVFNLRLTESIKCGEIVN